MRDHAESHPCVQLIVNEGGGAGASLEHSHAQLYALDFVPVLIARERERFTAYNQRTMGGDLLADIAAEEVRRRERLVAIDDEAMVICPWASRSPFELRVIPREPAARFESDGDIGVGALAHRPRRPPRALRRGARAQPLGAHRPPRRRRLPLAHRHRPPARDQGGLRVRHRRRHQHLPARAGRRRAARLAWLGWLGDLGPDRAARGLRRRLLRLLLRHPLRAPGAARKRRRAGRRGRSSSPPARWSSTTRTPSASATRRSRSPGAGFSVLVSEADGGERVDLGEPAQHRHLQGRGARPGSPTPRSSLPRAGRYRVQSQIDAEAIEPRITFG